MSDDAKLPELIRSQRSPQTDDFEFFFLGRERPIIITGQEARNANGHNLYEMAVARLAEETAKEAASDGE